MAVKFRYKDPNADVSKMESIVVENKTVELSNSQFKQSANFNQAITLAKGAKGKDDQGYRAEFIHLAESTRDMAESNTLAAE